MKRKAKIRRPKKRHVSPTLAEQLWGPSGFSETHTQEVRRLNGIIGTLEMQRDDALRALTNRTNIRKTVTAMDTVVANVNKTITDLQTMAKRLRTTYWLVTMAEDK